MIGRRVRLPVDAEIASALLDGKSPECLIETETEARAVSLWFGASWSGDPAEPDDPGPHGNHEELVLMAADVAQMAAHPTDYNDEAFWPGLRMRAQSALAARRQVPPVIHRKGFRRDDIEVVHRSLPYARYFDLEDVRLRHPTFSGGMSDTILRSCLRAADAVTVLPYDPATDQVLLVEQFRPGAFSRGDPNPWVLEPVAGRVDRIEAPEEVAHREAKEEAGLDLYQLEKIAGYYPSPGAMTEYLTSFLGLCHLADHDEGVHGLETEAEDICTHILSFAAAMDLLSTGEADNGPLLLSLYYLQANRARLRGADVANV
ncbi:MAG: NUDIX domain-containing protein [Pseudomonadota bacterium]